MKKIVNESLYSFLHEAWGKQRKRIKKRYLNKLSNQDFKELMRELNNLEKIEDIDALIRQYDYGYEETNRRRAENTLANRKQGKSNERSPEKFIYNAF